ncbi:VanZ family protein [Phycicoccus sonneratiae]|uniref:VanZ family protein n=1 Tax=Phycicoccus sonneratiae TaxID=2807628 RepID=A0ABS2CH06_9MICO|nr:VanZ family protein [Phycicoccus sonneraticus]MBM6399149.1 VanZ family protein [Phycicoccus sonneraticus]
MLRRVATVLALVFAVLLGGVLLWPDGSLVNRAVVEVYVVLLHAGVPSSVRPEHYAAALNVLAFVPLGWLGVAWLRRRVPVVVLALGGLSAAVEAVQLLPVLHREATLLDVACNTAGALLGALAGSLVREQPTGEELVDEGRDVGGDHLG